MLRVNTGGEDAVEIAMPPYVRARADEIARLSRRLGDDGSGFRSSRDVLAPALVYGLAHMQERYRQGAPREGEGGERAEEPPPGGGGATFFGGARARGGPAAHHRAAGRGAR